MTAAQKQNLQQQALQTFQRDLPQLWTKRPGQWVAYQGDQQLDFAAQKQELYQHCFQRGLQRDEFVIFCIEPQETEIVFGLAVLDEGIRT